MDNENYERKALIFSDKGINSNKYYIMEIKQEGENRYSFITRYGRLGRRPQVTSEPHITRDMAQYLLVKKYNEKLRKGYKEVDITEIMSNHGEFIS